MVIIVPADVSALNGARPSAVMTKDIHVLYEIKLAIGDFKSFF